MMLRSAPPETPCRTKWRHVRERNTMPDKMVARTRKKHHAGQNCCPVLRAEQLILQKLYIDYFCMGSFHGFLRTLSHDRLSTPI